MSPPFQVQWEGVCFLCRNPVDVRVDLRYEDALDIIKDMTCFIHHHPIDLTQNEMFWKVRGGRAYRCCRWCGEKPWPIPNLMKREVGAVRPRRHNRSESMSGYHIYMWFKSLHAYMNMDPGGKFKTPPAGGGHRSGLILRLV